MRGTVRKITLRRRLIVDLMRASMRVPFVSLRRTLDIAPLLDARSGVPNGPGWAAIFAKAFALVAEQERVLRTLYVSLPWPHFYELPHSIGMIAISRRDDGEDCVMPQKLGHAETLSLAEIDGIIRHAKTAAAEDVPMFRKLLRITALPLPLRRLLWDVGLNIGRQHANFAGNYSVTSVSAFGAGELHAVSPGPYVVTYDRVAADQTIGVVIRWDHRVTDAAVIARTLTRLEEVLNGAIASEIRASRSIVTPVPIRVVAT